MESRHAAEQAGDAPQATAAVVDIASADSGSWSSVALLLWAGTASTLHRIRRGEGALLAVNLSLIAHQASDVTRDLALGFVSALVMGLMYAFNDLYDAPADATNPKKDPLLVSTYLRHQRSGIAAIFALKGAALAFSSAVLGPRSTLAVAAVMLVNITYSMRLKGVPILDVAWCGVWGALYAAIVDPSPSISILVALMTAVCHLYQTLDDRVSDAANGIITTAVRSAALSRNVLFVLSLLLYFALRGALGDVAALTAFTPLVLFFAVARPVTGWVLTKVYFGVVWLFLLGMTRAAG